MLMSPPNGTTSTGHHTAIGYRVAVATRLVAPVVVDGAPPPSQILARFVPRHDPTSATTQLQLSTLYLVTPDTSIA
ncbi:hypothetical protein Nepgr_004406 [Nepenthes gracilis]|uniref:Uncharacterized protein n=1 Tax=Nepenthes gracilis TaxID=150966 RepID=A0AAD3S1A9_NEPGR|nr:hypothetical protein Nepgr_004406 [Nepenthes gracilis]